MTDIASIIKLTDAATPGFWAAASCGLVFVLMFYYPVVEKYVHVASNRWFHTQLGIHYFFFIGTAIHEISHAMTSLMLLVPVYKIVLFSPKQDKKQRQTGSYTLGYVEHGACDPVRSTIIGIAPLIGCALATYLTFVWAVDPIHITDPITPATLFEGIKWMVLHPLNWKNIVFLYMAIACALAGEPSDADMKSAPLLILVFIFIGGIFYLFRGMVSWDAVSKYTEYALKVLMPLFAGTALIMFFEVFILACIHAIGFYLVRKMWGLRFA